MDPRQIILEPIVTEKSTIVRELYNKYSFKVIPSATKPQIASAIEAIFDVKVLKVHTVNMDGKVKRLGRNLGRRSAWKKAIVTLAEGDSVDFFEGV
ncbi:MAG: 50S ribosomal protein L23 [Gemmatimonadaceae bacterium 4484_173]|jgi:large subunit ribosomal protein L23|nr:MAG: 50S ribosomal protein L23 [Gemmatimonadaceae bacterium 4484_173]RKZ02861.1 MAG: 50S ribosomal protein L23 [Candidatus Fermentibacteria bacterium]